MPEFIFIVLQFALFLIVYFLAMAGDISCVLIAGVAVIPLYGAMTIYEIRRERWILSPLVVYLAASIIYLGFVSIYMYAALAGGYDIFYIGEVNVEAQIPLAVALSILSVLCFYCGYKLTEVGIFKKALRKAQGRTMNYDLRLWHWLAFIILGWLLFVFNRLDTELTSIGFINGILLEITCGAPFFLLISRYGRWKGELRVFPAEGRLILAAIALAAYVFFSAMGSGMRFPTITIMFYFIWGYMLQQEILLQSQSPGDQLRLLAKPALMVLGSMVLMAAVIMPYGKQIFRAKIVEGEKIIVEKSEHHFYELRETFPEEGVWSFPNRLALNASHALAATVNLYGILPPEHQVHELVTMGIIPRLFWPEKPFVSQGPYFSLVVGSCEGESEKDATTSTATTAPGELYWSYGLKGIIFGMGLLGFLFGFTFKVVSRNFPAHPIKALVSIMLVQHGMQWFGADATALFVSLIFFWVVLAVPIFIRVPAVRGSRTDRKFAPAGGGG